MSKSRAPSTKKSLWDRHQSTIERLYVEEKRSIDGPEGVMSYMERNYGFHANKSQYEYRISKWGKKKNIKKQQWRIVARILAQRSAEGKETEVRFQGNLISAERVARELTRYATSTTNQIVPARPSSNQCVHEANAWSGHEFEELGDVTVATPIVPTEPEILLQDFASLDVELYASTLQYKWPPPIVATGSMSMLYSTAWMHPMCFPVRLDFQPFHWLLSLDWKIVPQSSPQSDVIKASAVLSDNLFHAPTTAIQKFFDGSQIIAKFSHVIVTILNNLDHSSDLNIDLVYEWLGSLPHPTLRRFFKALPPPLLDVLRQEMFKAAMKRIDETTVHAMLELGYDARESIIVDAKHWRHPVPPLYRALVLQELPLAKTIATHLSQVECKTELQNLLQNITDGYSMRYLHGWRIEEPFTLEEWTNLMLLPLAKGASPTLECFKMATGAVIDELLYKGNTLTLLEEGLVKYALEEDHKRRLSKSYMKEQEVQIFELHTKRIITYLLGDGFKTVKGSTPKLRIALSEAMEFALGISEFWAVGLIHEVGLGLQPPLTSATYTCIMKTAIHEAWITGDWYYVRQQVADAKPQKDFHSFKNRVSGANTKLDFNAVIAEAGNWKQYDRHTMYDFYMKAARFGRDDAVITAFLARQKIREHEREGAIPALLVFGRASAVSMLIVMDERFARALDNNDPSRNFLMLETLLHRSFASRYRHKFRWFGISKDHSDLQKILRALSYHAIHTKDLALMGWLMTNGLEASALWYRLEYDCLFRAGKNSEYLQDTWNYQDGEEEGYFPSLLSIVAQRNEQELIRILLAGGVDPADSDALRAAVAAKANTSTIQILLSVADRHPNRHYGVGAMREAIRQGNNALVSLLAKHIDIHGMETNGSSYESPCSPLGQAIWCHCRESAQFLIDSGVQLEALVTWSGMNNSLLTRLTPMLTAVFVDDLPMVELLANAGAALDHGYKLGLLRTPLQSAAELGRFEIVRYLLSKDVPADSAPFHSGGTPLQLAAISGFTGVAELLLEYGADVNYPPSEGDGRTAFEGAAEWGRIDMMTLLVRWGADLDRVSRPKPLHDDSSADTESTRSCQFENEDSDEDEDEGQDEGQDEDENEVADVYGTQYERALVFAERRGEMASNRFVQHLRREIRKGSTSFSFGTTFERLH